MEVDLSQAISAIIAKGDKLSNFEKNILAICEYSAPLVNKLLEIKTNKKFQIFMGKDPIDINIVNSKTYEYMFEHPVQEVQDKIVSFEKAHSRYPALFFYGLGNGVFLKAILNNPSHKRIVIFEPEIEIIYAVLTLFDFSRELHDTRLIILQSDVISIAHYYALAKIEEILRSAKIYDLNIYNRFYGQYKDDIVKINKALTDALKQSILETGNDAKDTLIGIDHHTKNIPNMVENLPLSRILKTRAKKIKSAIIVSTGPSLKKQLPILKKVAPYATIISIDASYPILKKYGIHPDYVTSIERVELTSKFFEEPKSEFDDGIIFVVSSLTHPKTIENLNGRQVCYAMRPLDYESGFKDDDYGYIGKGPSAAHLAYDLAYLLEHEQIIFIGQDLAFGSDGTSHSKGHIFKSTEINPNKTKTPLETAVAYGGKGTVQTTLVWNLFRKYFEHNIIYGLNKGMKIYNCTEGGARINGMSEAKFSDVADDILKSEYKKLAPVNRFSKKIRTLHLNRAKRHIKSIISYGEKLQKRAERVFLKLAAEIEKDKALKKENKDDKINYAKLQRIATEVDKIKEIVSEVKFVMSFNGVCGLSILHQDLELMTLMVKETNSEQDKKDKLFEWVSLQGYWLFSLAGYINAELETIKKSSEAWL